MDLDFQILTLNEDILYLSFICLKYEERVNDSMGYNVFFLLIYYLFLFDFLHNFMISHFWKICKINENYYHFRTFRSNRVEVNSEKKESDCERIICTYR